MGNLAKATAILVFNRHGLVLLQKRDNIPSIPEPGKWDVWGGHCEEGETFEACAIRELYEEIGVEIADPRTLKLLMRRSTEAQEQWVFAYFYDADGTPPVYEGERAEWFAPEEAAHLTMAFGAEALFSPDMIMKAKVALSLA
jgi:8-oxo-dGTP diphosphatase